MTVKEYLRHFVSSNTKFRKKENAEIISQLID